jgi:hypothetical protein
MAAISWESWRRRRWLPPLVAIAALCLASLAVAFVTARSRRSAGGWLDGIAATLGNIPHRPPPITVAPEPAPARPSAAVTIVQSNDARAVASSGPPGAATRSDVDSAPEVERAPPAYPAPIVLHVEPPIELDDAGAPVTTDGALGNAAPAASASAAPAASVAPAASAAPSASAAPQGVTCGKTQCAPGKVCCNASCGTCTNPGERCSQFVCGMNMFNESQSCGPTTCNVGEVCCNASCGTCIHPGDACDATRRCSNEITFPDSQSCGMQTCNVGLVCCNPSCGICAPPGEPCSQDACR